MSPALKLTGQEHPFLLLVVASAQLAGSFTAVSGLRWQASTLDSVRALSLLSFPTTTTKMSTPIHNHYYGAAASAAAPAPPPPPAPLKPSSTTTPAPKRRKRRGAKSGSEPPGRISDQGSLQKRSSLSDKNNRLCYKCKSSIKPLPQTELEAAEKALQEKIAADNDGWSDVEDDATVVVDDVLPVVEVNKVVEDTEIMDDKVADGAPVAIPRKRGWFSRRRR